MLTSLLVMPALTFGSETASMRGWRLGFADQSTSQAQPGSLTLLVAPGGDTLFLAGSGKGLFELSAGGVSEVGSADREVDADYARIITTTLYDPDNQPLPLRVETTYTTTSRELNVSITVTTTSQVKINKGLWVEIPCTSQGGFVCRNTAGQFTRLPPVTESKPQKLPYQSSISLPSYNSRMRVNLRNPMIPVPVRAVNSLRLELLCADPPCTTVPQGLGTICSILQPGDTIQAEFGVINESLAHPAPSILAFSPHPNGAEQTAYFAYDDIPTPELTWAIPTDQYNTHTPYISNYLKLLSLFPDVKFTWLMLTDNIQQLSEWTFKGWWLPSYGVYPDTSVYYTGRASCRLHQPSPSNRPSVVQVGFPVEPDSTYTIRGMYRADVHNRSSAFTIYVGVWPTGTMLNAAGFDVSSNNWLPFEFHFRANPSGVAYSLFKLEGSAGDLYLDDVSWIEDFSGKDLATNGGFEQYKSFPYFNGSDTAWYNASGMYHLSETYSPAISHWLRQLQDESPDWQFSSQIGLGLHGLHHTPNRWFVDDNNSVHEFNYYDPTGDSVRMARIVDDVRTVGLDPARAISFFRFLGHRHTESALHPVMKAGVRVIDAGEDVTNYHFGRIVREGRMIWQTSSVSWHDVYTQAHWEHLAATLDMGMFALMGTHFHTFAAPTIPGAWEDAVRLLGWMESTYPHLLWLKGDQLSRFWDELDQIHSIRQTAYGDHLALEWDGGASLGETIYMELPNDGKVVLTAAVDGEPIRYEIRGSRVFIILPRLEQGHHSLDLIRQSNSAAREFGEDWSVSTGSSENVTISRLSVRSSKVSYAMFDAQGRRIGANETVSLRPGYQRVPVQFPAVPSGLYFVVIEEDGVSRALRLPKIR